MSLRCISFGSFDHLACVSILHFHLVDLGLSDVGSLFGLLQLMLHLPQLSQVSVGLLFLLTTKKKPLNEILQILQTSNYNMFDRKTTHSFLSLPLVRFHLQLEFVYQLLQSHHVLLVLLGLVFGDRKETISIICNICKNLAL